MNGSIPAGAMETARRRADSGCGGCGGCGGRGSRLLPSRANRGRGARQLDGACGVLSLHVRFGVRQRNRTRGDGRSTIGRMGATLRPTPGGRDLR